MSNKTSDEDVENIKDVKEYKINLSQKQSVELLKDTLNKFEIRGEQLYLLKIAIKNILAELEQMIKEREKYTIRLIDEEYRKVIENAQMDTSNDRAIAIKFATMQQQINEKDKRIQELEKEKQRYKIAFNQQVEVLKDTVKKLNDSIPKQVVIESLEDIEDYFDRLNGPDEDIEYIRQVKNELLEGER